MPIIDVDVTYPTDFAWAEQIAREEFSDALERAGMGMKAAIAREYVLGDAVVTGRTAKSFQVGEVEDLGDRMQIGVFSRGDRRLVAGWLETGSNPSSSKPSPEMLQRILVWARHRGLISRGDKEWEQRSKAWGLAKTILARGIEERRLVEQAEDHYARYITRIMNTAARRIEKRINERLAAESGEQAEV
jgi:hypothetical protein